MRWFPFLIHSWKIKYIYESILDTVDHNLLQRLEHIIGIKGTTLHLFESYLCGRFQFVHSNHEFSSYTTVSHGDPQGSMLGPILFTLHIRS